MRREPPWFRQLMLLFWGLCSLLSLALALWMVKIELQSALPEDPRTQGVATNIPSDLLRQRREQWQRNSILIGAFFLTSAFGMLAVKWYEYPGPVTRPKEES